MKMHQKLLDRRKIEKLVDALRAIKPDNAQIAEKVRTEADYFERNRERMRWPGGANRFRSSVANTSLLAQL